MSYESQQDQAWGSSNGDGTSRLALPIGAGTGGGDVAEQEPNDMVVEANVVRDLPFEYTGEISHDTDIDILQVSLTAGIPIEIDVFADIASLSSPLDPKLMVVSADFSGIIAINDDVSFPSDLNSRVNFVAPDTGLVYLVVWSSVGSGGPDYDYVVAMWPTMTPVFESREVEPNDLARQANLIVLPGVTCGTISAPGDVDVTWFEAEEGTTIVVDLHSRIYGTPLDSVVELLDLSGRTLFLNDDADSLTDSRFNLVVPYTGDYFLRVRDGAGSGGEMHGYILSVSLQDGANSPVITGLTFVHGNELRKVKGHNFSPSGTAVEIVDRVVSSVPSAVRPTRLIRVKPAVPVPAGHWVTTLNADGRRSNPIIPFAP